ncbi:MAG: phosphoenolpyruvate carboxykinase (GTP) [Candidatus Bathyarchaeia archaeon]
MSGPSSDALEALRAKLGEESYGKLTAIDNPVLHGFIAKYVDLCEPESAFVSTGSPEDIGYIREAAIRNGEEKLLAIKGHTIHFDGYEDQARDRENTLILVPRGASMPCVRTGDREEKLREIHEIMRGIMRGHEMYICFYSLGPPSSEFAIPCVQITDSSYVAHSENILYRQGYNMFRRLGRRARFFKFIHSQGELDERKCSKNISKRRIYIDLEGETVYSVNTQYGGNSIGLKKLSLRLAINRASKEGWLAEHMLIMGVRGPGGRRTYFTGAFPSLCGKTSTAMLEGETIVGDDIAYLHKRDGEVRAINAEKGIFGIIQDINSRDDPIIWKVLHSPGEIIFSNVLVAEDGSVYWIGKDGPPPPRGHNHSGEWWVGKRDARGKEIQPSHPNARFTVGLEMFENLAPMWDDPRGVPVRAIVYGSRDSDTLVPVEEAFDWEHGIATKGASLESETTAAVLGKEGIREFNPMSNLDFLSIPLGKYIQNNLDFGKGLRNPPRIFSVNYFLRGEGGAFLNDRSDKRVWFKWMELRVHEEVKALDAPTGRIPLYEDLRRLFKEILGRDYAEGDYAEQFKIRVRENLAKIDRIIGIYGSIPDAPKRLFELFDEQRRRLIEARERYGDYISPMELAARPSN